MRLISSASGRPLAGIIALLLTAAPGPLEAQSFRDLALRVNLGDELEVLDASGTTSRGRLSTLTALDLVIDTPAGPRRFALDVRAIAVRHRQTRRAVLIGTGLGAATGLVLACTAEENEECGDAALVLGAVGAGVGALIEHLRPGWRRVFGAGTSGATDNAGTAGALDALALRANLGDRVRVRDRAGATIRGRLTHLTGIDLSVKTDAGHRRLDAADVQAVAVRRFSVGRGALIGAGLFTALAYAAPACRDNPDCVPLVAAPFGAGVGAAIGALIPRWTSVYPARPARATLLPLQRPRAIGARLAVRW